MTMQMAPAAAQLEGTRPVRYHESENARALCSQERQAIFLLPAGLEGTSPEQKDTTAQMEAAAAQLEAAKRQREAETREGAIQEVEMVLQTYFHNLDNTYNKLATINENMDDVEVSELILILGRHLTCCLCLIISTRHTKGLTVLA